MSDTPIADMVATMIAERVPGHIIVMAIGLAERSADIPADTSADTSADRRRTLDRERKRKHRSLLRGKQTMSAQDNADKQADTSADNADVCLNDSKLYSESVVEKERIQEHQQPELVEGRKRVSRGTRLTSGTEITDSQQKFALDSGLRLFEVDRVWAEFVDYWVGVPGSRGVKADWDATWRNWVRRVLERKSNGKGNYQTARKSTGDAFFAGIKAVAEDLARDSPMAGDGAAQISSGRDDVEF